MICQNCCKFVIPYEDKKAAKRTVRVIRYNCPYCFHKGEQWESLQTVKIKEVQKGGKKR